MEGIAQERDEIERIAVNRGIPDKEKPALDCFRNGLLLGEAIVRSFSWASGRF